jgi:hypothetical protein
VSSVAATVDRTVIEELFSMPDARGQRPEAVRTGCIGNRLDREHG